MQLIYNRETGAVRRGNLEGTEAVLGATELSYEAREGVVDTETGKVVGLRTPLAVLVRDLTRQVAALEARIAALEGAGKSNLT